jgi:Mg-chelatase subunit ChlD
MSERLRRWRLVLGEPADEGTDIDLGPDDAKRDAALGSLYDIDRTGGLGGSSPRVARWLGDIRSFFPTSVVQVMQRDAMDRLGLRRLLLEPEMLETVQPDVHLVATLVGLKAAIPQASRETARMVVRKVVDQLEARLAAATRTAVSGALHRAQRTRRPQAGDIDWNRTIAANLKHYQPEYRTVIPERLIGFGRRTPTAQRDLILAIDQSGSMAASVVYASVFAAVLASMRTIRTRLVAFDTAVVDLSEELDDPVDLLFGIQLGGGTDIAGALAYCQELIERPADTIVVLLSDLYEGGVRDELLARVAAMVADGVQVIALLALSDEGAPSYDSDNAAALTGLGVPTFACTPDVFPELMAAAIERRDLVTWLHQTAPPAAPPPEPEGTGATDADDGSV